MLRLCSATQNRTRQNQAPIKTFPFLKTSVNPSLNSCIKSLVFGSNIAMRGKGNTMVEKLLSLSEAERQGYLKDELIIQELTLDYFNRLDTLSRSSKNHPSLGKQQAELKHIACWLEMPEADYLSEIAQNLPK